MSSSKLCKMDKFELYCSVYSVEFVIASVQNNLFHYSYQIKKCFEHLSRLYPDEGVLDKR